MRVGTAHHEVPILIEGFAKRELGGQGRSQAGAWERDEPGLNVGCALRTRMAGGTPALPAFS